MGEFFHSPLILLYMTSSAGQPLIYLYKGAPSFGKKMLAKKRYPPSAAYVCLHLFSGGEIKRTGGLDDITSLTTVALPTFVLTKSAVSKPAPGRIS